MKILLVLCVIVACVSGCGTLEGALRDSSYLLGGASEAVSDAADNISLREAKRYK